MRSSNSPLPSLIPIPTGFRKLSRFVFRFRDGLLLLLLLLDFDSLDTEVFLVDFDLAAFLVFFGVGDASFSRPLESPLFTDLLDETDRAEPVDRRDLAEPPDD